MAGKAHKHLNGISPLLSTSPILNYLLRGCLLIGNVLIPVKIVFQKPLLPFSKEPMTGFYRNGSCEVGPEDKGNHAIAGLSLFSFPLPVPIPSDPPVPKRIWEMQKLGGMADTNKQTGLTHTPKATLTDSFLDFSASRGNDLRSIPGLKAGGKWCLCVNRWKEAVDYAEKNGGKDVRIPLYLEGVLRGGWRSEVGGGRGGWGYGWRLVNDVLILVTGIGAKGAFACYEQECARWS